MPIDLSDEIVQDFLVEAGEILQRLGEEVVDLETRADDQELLNSVFRGLHTIKGGAGFLDLEGMVSICHAGENLFDLVRQGKRRVTPSLMDLMLRVLDSLNAMFEQLNAGEAPQPAERGLHDELLAIVGEDETVEMVLALDATPVEPALTFITSEFASESEALEAAVAEALAGGKESPASLTETTAVEDDQITEEEFETLLDELHGSGAPGGNRTPWAQQSGDEITDQEFEALLDELHGEGKGPTEAMRLPASEPANVEPMPPANSVTERTVSSPPQKVNTTVRVDTALLDCIMNMVGELVIVRNRIATIETLVGDEEMAKAASNLDVVTADLQAAVMRTRMQPIKRVFGRFPRVVRDLARTLGKEVELIMKGEETDLDKNLVEALADPLIHLVRNAVDHGIEPPDVREAAGKPKAGQVHLTAEQQGDQILLTIADDGGGMEPDALRRKAVEKGILDADAAVRLSEDECFNLIFHPGFSTRQEVSDVSGRGVGMDVVKNSITQLNGSVDIESVSGVGTRMSIKVPLTLAIVPTLMVMLGEQIFALPLVNVKEIFNLEEGKTNLVDDQRTILVRGKPLPLFFLSQWLVDGASGSVGGYVVVVQVGNQMMGFVVDELLGQQEVVIKPLGAYLQGTQGLAGATITGDGRIALVIDVPELIAAYTGR